MARLLRIRTSASILGLHGRLTLIGLLFIGAACHRAPSDQRKPAQQVQSAPQVAKIDWKMTRTEDDKALRIEYRVTNATDKRIYLSDVIHEFKDGQRIVPELQRVAVMNDTEPRVVCFARGRVPSLASPTVPFLDPGSRPIDPGQTVSGYAQVQLPLEAESYAGTVSPLKWWPKAAVLQLGYFRSEPKGFKMPLPEGGTLFISERTLSNQMEILRSDIKPLP